ncbi:MAG: O-antigen ligase family protein [Chromatiales bacterium]|nr:O-antigen ligase family protein [Chromatiales bacterium]
MNPTATGRVWPPAALRHWLANGLALTLCSYFLAREHAQLQSVFIALVLIPWLLSLPWRGVRFRWSDPADLLILLVPLWLASAVLWSVDSDPREWRRFASFALYTVCVLMVPRVLLTWFPRREKELLQFLSVAAVVGAIIALGAYFHRFGLQLPRMEPEGLLHRPIRAAMLYGAVTVVLMWLLLRAETPMHAGFYSVAMMPPLAIVLLSKSRGPLAALLIVSAWMIWRHGRGDRRWLWPVAMAGLAFAVLAGTTDLLPRLFSRDLLFISYRDEIWDSVLSAISADPWFGTGVSSRNDVMVDSGMVFSHSHNFVLSTWRFSGLVGVVLLLTQLGLALFGGYKGERGNRGVWSALLLFGVLCLSTNGSYPLSRPVEAWFVYWLPIGFLLAYRVLPSTPRHTQ